MNPELIDYLVCPMCKSLFELTCRTRDQEEILEGTLDCAQCEASYEITRGIPRILPASLEQEAHNTVKNFGWQWINLDRALQGTEFDSEEVILDFLVPIKPSFFKDKVILDAGCGAGRFSQLARQFGAKVVLGIDLSSCVEIAYEKTRSLDNVHIVQTDIYNLPSTNMFDFVYSIGVLHHLPDPRKGFESLTGVLKESGAIAFWTYGIENNEWYLKTVDPILKKITSRMSSRSLAVLCHFIMIGLYPVLKLIYKPINKSEKLKVLRRFLFCNSYFSFLSRFKYAAIHAIIFDQLTPQISHYWPKKEVSTWLQICAFEKTRISSRNGNSWRGLGTGFTSRGEAGLSWFYLFSC